MSGSDGGVCELQALHSKGYQSRVLSVCLRDGAPQRYCRAAEDPGVHYQWLCAASQRRAQGALITHLLPPSTLTAWRPPSGDTFSRELDVQNGRLEALLLYQRPKSHLVTVAALIRPGHMALLFVLWFLLLELRNDLSLHEEIRLQSARALTAVKI